MKSLKSIVKAIFFTIATLPLAGLAQPNCESDRLSDMEACAKQKLLQSQQQLDSAYQQAIGLAKQLDDYDQAKYHIEAGLIKTQDIWKLYIKENCNNARVIYTGGAEANLQYLACLRNLTEERLAQLRALYLDR